MYFEQTTRNLNRSRTVAISMAIRTSHDKESEFFSLSVKLHQLTILHFWRSWSLDCRPAVVTYQNKFCHSCVVTGSCLRSLFTVGFNSCHLSSNWTVGLFELNSREDILFSPVLLRAPAGLASSQAPIDRWTDRQTDRQTPFVTKQDMTTWPMSIFLFQVITNYWLVLRFQKEFIPLRVWRGGENWEEGWGRLSSVGGVTDRSSDK